MLGCYKADQRQSGSVRTFTRRILSAEQVGHRISVDWSIEGQYMSCGDSMLGGVVGPVNIGQERTIEQSAAETSIWLRCLAKRSFACRGRESAFSHSCPLWAESDSTSRWR
jgi:hypothetical protein